MTDLRLVDGIEIIDGLSAFQQFSRLRNLYMEHVESGDGPPEAQERRGLIELARRLLALTEPADLFLQTCQEQTQQVKDTPEFDQRLQALLTSDKLSGSVKGKLTGKDLLNEAEAGAQRARDLLADERERLPKELDQLAAGQRPKRSKASDDVSADAELGAGFALEVAGLGMATAAALAPKTAGASLVAGVAVAAVAVSAAGLILVIDAVT